MNLSSTSSAALLLLLLTAGVGCDPRLEPVTQGEPPAPATKETPETKAAPADSDAVRIHYLEIVTPDVDATCRALAAVHGVEFGAPQPELGNARTAALSGGGLLGVRGPLRPDEAPIVRPYVRVDDLEAAVAAAEDGGGETALPPTAIEGRGRIAIVFHGGIEHGLWEP